METIKKTHKYVTVKDSADTLTKMTQWIIWDASLDDFESNEPILNKLPLRTHSSYESLVAGSIYKLFKFEK